MKKTVILLLMLLTIISVKAQLRVNSSGNVAVCASNPNYVPRLSVGNNCVFAGPSSLGLAATPNVQDNKNNIGVHGYVHANQTYTSDNNYGVFGITTVNKNHGHNYGVSGMLDFTPSDTPYGGAGIYGTNYAYLFSYPSNIQGLYAGYFIGSVYLQGQTMAQEIYTPADERLSENAESIEEQNRSEGHTLDNLLKMNVLEFNLKNKQNVKSPDNLEENSEETRQAYEYMKKDEDELYSRRHFGLSAQELQTIYPNLVLEGQDGYLYVNYTELVPILIRSIQELKAEVDELKGSGGAIKNVSRSSEISSPSETNVDSQQAQTRYSLNINGQAVGVKKIK